MDRNAFHFAKLALFNIRLLNDIEQARCNTPVLEELVIKRSAMDHISLPVSLLHQATFLQFAYICLVWLWGKSKAGESIAPQVAKRFNFDEIEKVSGHRQLSLPKDYLRLIRNALSHANVKVEESHFEFSDINKRRGETEFTIVRLGWEKVGCLSKAVLFAINDQIYPTYR